MRERGSDEGMMLRPRPSLFSRGLLAALLLTTPVFAVTYWLTAATGMWVGALIVHLVVVFVGACAVLQYSRTFIRLIPGGITERGFLRPAHHVAATRVRSVVLLPVYRGSSLETIPQLFILDDSDRCLLRMRGQFWSSADMERAAEHLGAPIVRRSEPVTMWELRSSEPGYLYWFERVPARLRKQGSDAHTG